MSTLTGTPTVVHFDVVDIAGLSLCKASSMQGPNTSLPPTLGPIKGVQSEGATYQTENDSQQMDDATQQVLSETPIMVTASR